MQPAAVHFHADRNRRKRVQILEEACLIQHLDVLILGNQTRKGATWVPRGPSTDSATTAVDVGFPPEELTAPL